VLFALSNGSFQLRGEVSRGPALSLKPLLLRTTSFPISGFGGRGSRRLQRDFSRRFVLYNINTALGIPCKLALLVAINLLTRSSRGAVHLLALLVSGIANFLLQDRLVFSVDEEASSRRDFPRDSS